MEVLKVFDFISKLRRMSVVVRLNDSEAPPIHCFVKGAPEVIRDLCVPSSLPKDFKAQLGELTRQGYRVIAVAYRTLGEFSELSHSR